MTTKIMRAIFKPKALAIAVAWGCTAQAQAVSFNIEEIEGQFDSSLSIGASWGMRNAEGLIPVNMLFASQGLTDKLSVEAFYQLEWDETVLDNCGTFFGSDVAADGCNNNYTVGSPAIAPLQPIAAAFGQGFQVTPEGVVVGRASDRHARDSGQWGYGFPLAG